MLLVLLPGSQYRTVFNNTELPHCDTETDPLVKRRYSAHFTPSYIAQEFGFLVMKHKQSLLRGSKGVLRFPGFCNMVGNLGWLVPRDEGSKDKRGLFLKAWLVPRLGLFQDVKGPYVWKVPRHMKGPQIWGVPKWEFSRFAGFPGIRIPRYVGSLAMSKGMEVSQVWEVNMSG